MNAPKPSDLFPKHPSSAEHRTICPDLGYAEQDQDESGIARRATDTLAIVNF